MTDSASTPASPAAKSMDDIMSLCKRRGFIFQASEIYGGINGFWDYGPLGTMLKRNLREAWWADVVMHPCWGRKGPDGDAVSIVPLDTCIIQNPRVWEASGHVGGFNDPMTTCRECKKLFRADHLSSMLEEAPWLHSLERLYATKPVLAQTIIRWAKKEGQKLAPGLAIVQRVKEDPATADGFLAAGFSGDDLFADVRRLAALAVHKDTLQTHPCPNCGGRLTEPRMFNLMFESHAGAIRTDDNRVYLRPETAQGIFINFKNVVDTSRVRVPFGIAQTGKAFRNEVTPRNFTFRSREFEQMEIEFFCHESEAMAWYAFWRDWRMEWWKSLGLAGDNLILREHETDELAHYSKATSDIEYRFPFTAPGFGELEGVAYRGCFDLTQHQEHSKVKLDYFDTERGPTNPKTNLPAGERYIPHVIEPSAGLDRGVLALLCEAYTPDPERASGVYMKFHPRIAPIKAAVFPLVNKDGLPEIAERLRADLARTFGRSGLIETDAKQSIGKRYARMDEAGCPFCFTVDGQTREDGTVTVRHRDTLQQDRIATDQVAAFLAERLGGA